MKDKYKKKRNEIITAAFEVFGEKGYHATKIADIAERLNMGHGTFYRYFKNKLDIFSSVMDEIFADIIHVITREPPTKATTIDEYREQVNTIAKNLSEVFKKDIRKARILFYEVLGVDPELNKRFERAMALLDDYTEAYIVNGVNKGFFSESVDTQILGKAINAMIFASIKDGIVAENPAEARHRWTETIAQIIIQGIAR